VVLGFELSDLSLPGKCSTPLVTPPGHPMYFKRIRKTLTLQLGRKYKLILVEDKLKKRGGAVLAFDLRKKSTSLIRI
jgi:hypothetical protein